MDNPDGHAAMMRKKKIQVRGDGVTVTVNGKSYEGGSLIVSAGTFSRLYFSFD